MDSRLLTAFRDPPIGTPIQKSRGIVEREPLMRQSLMEEEKKNPSRMVCIPSAFAAFRFLSMWIRSVREGIKGGENFSQRGR